MNTRQPIEPRPEPSELMEPRERPLDYPAVPAEAAPVWGAAPGEHGLDAALAKCLAVSLRVVPSIALDAIGPPAWSTRLAAHERHRIDERQKLRHIVLVGGRDDAGERSTPRVSDDVVLGAGLGAVRRVRARLLPPFIARTDALSTIARLQSILSASRSRARSTS